MGLPRLIRVAFHVDKVLIPHRGWRFLGYAMIVPAIVFLVVSSFTRDYQLVVLAFACLLPPVYIWMDATEKYVLRHDPMPDKEDK